jgi:hypothetical protein
MIKAPVSKIQVKYPALSAFNDGYDKDGRWNGMTPEEVNKAIGEAMQRVRLIHWTPSSVPN